MNTSICDFLTKNSVQNIADLFNQSITNPIPGKKYPFICNSNDFHVQFFFQDILNLKPGYVIIDYFTIIDINDHVTLQNKLDALKNKWCSPLT